MYDMAAVKEKKLIALLLEEALPAGCVVEGVDFSAPDVDKTVAGAMPAFIKRYEDIACSEQRELDAIIEKDQQLIYTDKQAADEKVFKEKKVTS